MRPRQAIIQYEIMDYTHGTEQLPAVIKIIKGLQQQSRNFNTIRLLGFHKV